MKKVIFNLGLLLFLLGLSSFLIGNRYKEDSSLELKEKELVLQKQAIINNVVSVINEGNKDKLEVLNKNLKNLELQNYGPYVSLKLAIHKFIEAENSFNRTKLLYASLKGGNKLHPLVQENLDKTIRLYEECREMADRMGDFNDSKVGDPNHEYNFCLNYLKGEIYYRHLELLSKPETVRDLMTQTITYFRNALEYKPGDLNTVINIEILIKNREQMMAIANDPGAQKQQALIQKMAGSGNSKGN